MLILNFALGFFAAIIVLVILMSVIYSRMRRKRKIESNIEGYLDLISDLTSGQKEQVQDIRRVFLPKIEEIRINLRDMRNELAAALFEEPVDRTKLKTISERIIQLQTELENEVIEHILEENLLLTPTQKRRFHEIIIEQFSAGGLGVHDVRTSTHIK